MQPVKTVNQISSDFVSSKESNNLNLSVDSVQQKKKDGLENHRDIKLSSTKIHELASPKKEDIVKEHVKTDSQKKADSSYVPKAPIKAPIPVITGKDGIEQNNRENLIKAKPSFLSKIGSKINNLFKKIISLPKKLVNKIKLLFSRKSKLSNNEDKLSKKNDTIQSSKSQENHQANEANKEVVVKKTLVKSDVNPTAKANNGNGNVENTLVKSDVNPTAKANNGNGNVENTLVKSDVNPTAKENNGNGKKNNLKSESNQLNDKSESDVTTVTPAEQGSTELDGNVDNNTNKSVLTPSLMQAAKKTFKYFLKAAYNKVPANLFTKNDNVNPDRTEATASNEGANVKSDKQ